MFIIGFILIGIVSGILGGMGMGGGTLLIPLLTIFLGVGQKIAAGINLLTFLPLSIVAIIIHFKNKMIKKDIVLQVVCFFVVPGVIFAIGGALLAMVVPQRTIAIIFGVFLLVICLYEFFLFFKDIYK